ncbi:CWF19-like protein 2 isoform X3 [Tachysurus fulvidraco]|uniref:CWF19-like protein 2 isoform X3 n=1 Tax=Tachysurus fulvidraco TaxID=1234273 RepID=UPI001FEE869B|nr:CWF19-like protein 2 isoform X3 [Tachysurus fulvidraco]
MAAYAVGFESTGSIEEKRELKRKAREEILQKAKRQYEEDERQKEQRKARGEDTWMLPDVEQRLKQISEDNSIKGKKKKKEKSKKKKKEKKKKVKKEKSKTHDEDERSAESSEDCDDWVEAPPLSGTVGKAWKVSDQTQTPSISTSTDQQRDEWMTFDFLALKTTSVAERRAEKEAAKGAEREKAKSLEQAGLHRLELNPYWKNGGTGLPPEEGTSTAVTKAVVDDGGRSWLMKSYQRMKEQAEREKRNLDDVVAERYGSMEQFQKRLKEAEEAAMPRRREERDIGRKGEREERRQGWRRETDRERDWDRERRWERQRDIGRDRCTERDEDRRQDRDRGRDEDRRQDRNREKDIEREKDMTRNQGTGRDRGRFLKPSDSEDFLSLGAGYRRPGLTASSSSHSTGKFRKPGDDDDDVIPSRKREEMKEGVKEKEGSGTPKREEERRTSPVQKSSSESEEEEEEEEEVRLLTDEEMNKLGAKLVKAELMGNTALMDSLKAQLEAARKARETQTHKPKQVSMQQEAEQEMILFRTDQSGRAWPVSGPSQHVEPKGGRRKKKAIETHVSGERVRYFADDDRLDLKEMVRREKMTSSQDQNALYSRMAAKMMGKQDGDNYTLDDMFVSSAAQRERDGLDEERARARAMGEGRSLAARMDKCPFCFSNSELPKHLVVAIGAKVYLSLPNGVSLTEGHCFIAPLQHHCCATRLDEDVWSEVQVFRKSLVQMFHSLGLDCVFLETHLNPKKRMHMLYECVPLPRELGDMAPVYFKKAIMECDEEWAMNKKVVDLSSKNIRQAVPRGLPYFSVDFGLQGGFAHVIENQDKFPHYFGKEVLGGMLDLEPRRWRKPIRENFDDQRKKVLQFSQWWKPFDCTKSQ